MKAKFGGAVDFDSLYGQPAQQQDGKRQNHIPHRRAKGQYPGFDLIFHLSTLKISRGRGAMLTFFLMPLSVLHSAVFPAITPAVITARPTLTHQPLEILGGLARKNGINDQPQGVCHNPGRRFNQQ